MVVLIMGVSGIGKTTIGLELARQLGWTFLDADDDHSPEAKASMAAGTPLTDADREPWLERVRARMVRHIEQGENIILACSALKHSYRKTLRNVPDEVFTVHLSAPADIVASRLETRVDHFAGQNLLESQLRTLEPSRDAVTVDASNDVQTVVSTILSAMGLESRS
jgi:gluconokinase